MALLVGKNCVRQGATQVSALVAASAGGDTYDRYAEFLVVNNGNAASCVVTITPGSNAAYTPLGGVATPVGNGTPYTVTIPTGVREVIGLGSNLGNFNLAGGTITYSVTTTVTVGAYFSG